MSDAMTRDDPEYWEQRYLDGQMPWDVESPTPFVLDALDRLSVSGHVLEVGCGTGTNTIAVAQKGYQVRAVEVSATAMALAQRRAAEAKVSVEFSLLNLLEEPPAEEGALSFVFDRAVFHVLSPLNRARFAHRVATCLEPGGHWLTICGNADEVNEEGGPPRLTVSEIVLAVEPYFEIVSIEASTLGREPATPRVFVVLARKRPLRPPVWRRDDA